MVQSVMRIGASTAIYWNYKEHDLLTAMKHMCDMGFSCVEILCEHPFYTNWATEDAEKEKESIKELLDSYELDVSVHAPYHDLNIASLNPGIRSETVRQLREAIEVASDLNGEVLVVHPGFVASRKYPKGMAHGIMVDTLIGLENIANKPKALAVHATELVRTVADVGSKNLRVTFDVAHANTIGTTLIDFVDTLGKLIKHVHVSDNKGFDDHLPIGVGNIDYRVVISKLIENGYKGLLIIEGWIPSDPDQFVKLSKDKLKDMLKGL